MVSISVCMIVKNEEAVLARCLDSLKGVAEEIVVVDTGSTDRTKEIAARYTDKIYDFAWVHDFSAARNFAFSKATKDYIYSADADEVLEEKEREKLLQLKQVLLPEIEIVEMIYVNPEDCNMVYNFTREPRPKLFKRLREFRWIDPVHETVALNPLVYSSDIEILHLPQILHSSRDFQAMERELKKNGRLSDRLFSMYAKELFISGTKEDFLAARPWFQKRAGQAEYGTDAHVEAACVLVKTCSMLEEWEELLALGLMELALAQKPPAELFYLFGQYYEKLGRLEEAAYWYRRAALEAECIICISYGGEFALQEAIRVLRELGREEEARQYEALLG